MATISLTRSSEIFGFSAMFNSEKKVLQKKLKIQPNGKEYQKGNKQSTNTTGTKLLNSEVGQKPSFCKGKRAFAEISESKSVLTHVDHLEGVNRVNYQKRQKIDNVKPVTTTTAPCVNGSRGSVNCQGSRLNDLTRPSSVDSTGRFSSKDNRQSPRPATPTTGDACGEGKEVIDHDAQMSPRKALRAAMLRTRFADTILKARNTLLFKGEKDDSLRMQHEKELFEKKQQEDKIRVAAEVALKKSQEAKLKKQREREREASRIALEKMKKTIEIYEWQDIMRDFEMLISPQP
ncbi:hypothetical protein BVC80_8529g2 [Macleaya cordata]|uniref:Uncharacterized protein n=1 Tax=Macleaya cordata TaxID=56857 RepID=A0A200Q2U1_MACCD|nr:hypothetical protein BVC80_8529g2 [Macleaya cordata]